jgi:hypothetical protein
MYFEEIGWEGVEWIHVAERLVVVSCEQSNEPSGSIKYRTFLTS